MAEIKIDNELVQAISILVTGAMQTGNQNYLPAILKAKEFLHIVTNNAQEKEEKVEKPEDHDPECLGRVS